MKKVLITLAVLNMASAAMAQSSASASSGGYPQPTVLGAPSTLSSVILYGDADIAIGKAKSAGDQKWGLQSNSIVTSNGHSRYGLLGKEDLGNGMWAGFNYEGDINANTGAGDGWVRSAWVGLGSTTWGTLMLGRNYTVGFTGLKTYELTHLSQYSVLDNTFGIGGWPIPFSSAEIKYRTPTIHGLSSEISYVPKADGALIEDGTANQSDHWGVNVTYNQGPIKAAAIVDKPSNTQPGGNANKANWSLGGSYTFGQIVAVSATYSRTNDAYHWQGTPGVIFGAQRYGWELGSSVFMGPFTVTLDLTHDTKNELYGGRKYTNGVLEGRYRLSKQTYFYADYLRLDGDNNYGIGINHLF
jgi:predicted porin